MFNLKKEDHSWFIFPNNDVWSNETDHAELLEKYLPNEWRNLIQSKTKLEAFDIIRCQLIKEKDVMQCEKLRGNLYCMTWNFGQNKRNQLKQFLIELNEVKTNKIIDCYCYIEYWKTNQKFEFKVVDILNNILEKYVKEC
jgi:hypothetical protein